MSGRITNNQASADIVRHINVSHRALLKTMEKLSSGQRINRASDDPSGLVISEQMRARIATLNREIENTTQTIRKYDTADATASQLSSILHGIRSMAVAAADETTDEAGREAYAAAARRAAANYNRIVQTAAFNGAQLLDGSPGALASISPLPNIDLSDPDSAAQAVLQVDQAMAELNQARVDIGSTQKYDLEAQRSNLEVTAQNLTAAESQIRDTDYALTVVDMIREEIRLKAGIALLAHADMTQRTVLSLLGD
jgi:flagellin